MGEPAEQSGARLVLVTLAPGLPRIPRHYLVDVAAAAAPSHQATSAAPHGMTHGLRPFTRSFRIDCTHHLATLDLPADDFTATITEHETVLVDFWAPWCGPCRMFAPKYEQASEVHPDVVFAKVDTDAERDLAAAARITSIPTLMAFRRGHRVFSQPGALSTATLEQLIAAVQDLDLSDDAEADVEATRSAS